MRIFTRLPFLIFPLAAACGSHGLSGSTGGVPVDRDDHDPHRPAPGQLTAGVWDDNRNYGLFRAYLDANTGKPGLPTIDVSLQDAAAEAYAGDRAPNESLDIALMIDTTGSMSDELEYVTSELSAIAAAIHGRFPSASQRWALIVYRDDGDEYVVRSFDFTSELDEIQDKLADQRADGGGDTPEAADAALSALTQLSWRSGATARMAFWIADAPHHDDRAGAMKDLILGMRAHDIHMYPIAASGTDELTELTMRISAQLTGGRYLFLTDDSGIGASHKEPTIPCYFVTRLDKAVIRMAAIELSGRYEEPVPDDILRTAGDPESGQCALEDNEAMATAF